MRLPNFRVKPSSPTAATRAALLDSGSTQTARESSRNAPWRTSISAKHYCSSRVKRGTGLFRIPWGSSGMASHGLFDFDFSKQEVVAADLDRKSTRLNSSHLVISYAV